MRLNKSGKAAITAGLAFALAMSPLSATVAAAVTNDAIESTSAELETARAELDALTAQCDEKFAELEDQQAELEITRTKISETEGEIEVKEKELVEARAVLSESMAENYKSGINILSFLFGSSSLDDLVSRVYYADKVAEHQSDAISTVLTIQEELDSQKATLETEQKRQEELVEEGKQIASELQSAVNDQQNYVNGLDAQLQEQIAAQIEAERKAAEEQARKEAEEKARKEAEEKARKEAEERAAAEAAQQEAEPEQEANNTPAQTAPEPQAQTQTPTTTTTTTTTESSSSSSSSSSSHAVPNLGQGVSAAIGYAKSQLGVSYSWSGSAIAYQEFDCSGLIWWSFKQAGISIPRGQRLSNGRGNSMIGWCLDNGGWTTSQANLKAGDLMFWGSSTSSTGHVGMCIGGGMMIHSSWGGVEICSVYYNSGTFVGGGPIV